MKQAIAALCVVFGLSACASNAPMIYLVLSPVSGPVYTAPGANIVVNRVLIPPEIDRSFLTIGNGNNALDINYNAQWAAPLDAMAQTILARDLAERLIGHNVLMPGDNVPSGTRIISVNIITLLPYANHVVLAADWHVSSGKTQGELSGRVHILMASSSNAKDQAQAMSQALGQLADKIAGQIAL